MICFSSSFDEYLSQLVSGKLDWTPVHTSKVFWSENVKRIQEKKDIVFEYLVVILTQSTDPKQLAIASNDITQILHVNPHFKV